MPPKPKEKNGPKKKESANKSTAGRRKMATPPNNSPTQEDSPATTMTGRKRQQANSMGGSRLKQPKIRPLTTTDIPDIVSAIVRALPPRTQMDPVRSSRRKRSNPAETIQSTQTEQTSCRRTGTTVSLEPQDSTNKEDIENEDFSKQQYKLYFA